MQHVTRQKRRAPLDWTSRLVGLSINRIRLCSIGTRVCSTGEVLAEQSDKCGQVVSAHWPSRKYKMTPTDPYIHHPYIINIFITKRIINFKIIKIFTWEIKKKG